MGDRRLFAVGSLVLLLAVAAAGCGSSGKSSSGTTTTTSTTSNGATTTTGQGQAALAAFQSCLAAHGVKVSGQFGRPPNGQPPAGGQPPTGQGRPAANSKQQKAFAACRSKLPAGARNGFGQGAPGGGQSNPAFAKYTKCLRQHGVTFGGTNSQKAFKKASAACAKYAPKAGGSGS